MDNPREHEGATALLCDPGSAADRFALAFWGEIDATCPTPIHSDFRSNRSIWLLTAAGLPDGVKTDKKTREERAQLEGAWRIQEVGATAITRYTAAEVQVRLRNRVSAVNRIILAARRGAFRSSGRRAFAFHLLRHIPGAFVGTRELVEAEPKAAVHLTRQTRSFGREAPTIANPAGLKTLAETWPPPKRDDRIPVRI